jgi:hypothetical protein
VDVPDQAVLADVDLHASNRPNDPVGASSKSGKGSSSFL